MIVGWTVFCRSSCVTCVPPLYPSRVQLRGDFLTDDFGADAICHDTGLGSKEEEEEEEG